MLSRTCTIATGLSMVCLGLATPVGLKDLEGFAMNPAISTFKDSAIPDYALRILNATQYPQAVCLDGTQGAYYHRPALSGSAANKWRIFFQGGGWCVSDEDCYGRSQTPLGSNLNLTATAVDPAGYCGSSFLSGDPADAPGFWDWHAVYVPYCDGGSMTGKNETRTIVNGAEIHYKGGFIRDAFIADLITAAGVATATDIIIGGCSAGGLTTYLNIDAIRDGLPATARVVGVPDAGFFLDHPDMNGNPFRTPLFQWGFEAWNASATLSPACLAHYAPTADTWRCIFAQYAAPFIATPLWIINSNFDSCQLNGCELNLPDVNKGWGAFSPAEVAAAEAYRTAFMDALAPVLSAPRNGGFVDSCLLHCQAGTSNWWQTLVSPKQGATPVPPNLALESWYYGNTSSSWWIDSCETPPCNPTC